MNQFEIFVAGSESARSDAWRYLRRLRELDERIEANMNRLNEIISISEEVTTTHENKSIKTKEQTQRRRKKNKENNNNIIISNNNHRKSGKRGRSPSPSSSLANERVDFIIPDDAESSNTSSVIFVETQNSQLFSEYRTCRRRVIRHALEREKIANELKACGDEISQFFNIGMSHLKEALNITEDSS